jgi:chemosensory pili system protein ChpA (sensor histidine kinase/response regulator)
MEPDETDYQLRDIYARETDSHVAVVRAFIERALADGMPVAIPEPVYRACHTLAGSSRMADARHGIRLAQPLDHWLRKAFDGGVELTPEELVLLGECMTAMESVSRHLDESTGFFVAHGPIAERIAVADAEVDRRMQLRLSQASPPVPAPVEAPPPPASFDYSPEIASIFADEATELLEGMQAEMSGITPSSLPDEAVKALKRPLHTLKGGARLAGILTMGDLAHEVESLITRIELGLTPWGAPAFDALQAGLDELARMRDLIVAGEPVPAATALTSRLQAVDGSAPVPAAEPALPAEAAPIEAEPEPVFLPESVFVPESVFTPEAAFAPEQTFVQVPPAVMPEPAFVPETLHEAEPIVAVAALNAAVAPWRADALAVLTTIHVPDLQETAPVETPPVELQPVEEQTLEVPPVESPAPVLDVPAGIAAVVAPPGREAMPAVVERVEMARVDPELLDELLNVAGEVSVGRARVEQQLGSIDFNLGELARTVTRLKEQLRNLEIETEAQILHRHENESAQRSDFDPLELDRYSSIQQFSRGLAETAGDVASIQGLLESLTKDTQALLQQQGRAVVEMQNGLMRTRMVPFQRHVQRLTRIVRQTATETQKQVELIIEGASGEFDRQVLERMLPPLEHLLRNAVVHGIELPSVRVANGKPAIGRITLDLRRDGSEFSLLIADDGAGMDLAAIRAKGVATGLIHPTQQLSDEALLQLVLEPGFSTAGSVTQSAGRGVGMDVVATEVKKLGGSLNMASVAGQGSTFSIRLPFTLAVSQALVVRIGEECYALPLPTVEGVVRLPAREVASHLGEDVPPYVKDGYRYRLQSLGIFVGTTPQPLPDPDVMVPVVLVRAGEHSTGLVADELIGSREIVVKSVGPQIASIRGISGATILGDGRIAIILDIGALLRAEWRGRAALPAAALRAERRVTALVVDDSITVRRVTQRLLERNGMRVVLARDGVDAMALLQDMVPDVILLDVEMPRMDGYEVATQVRADPRTHDVPIIMITSRMGDKHRTHALGLGVDDYLGKPYQEGQLLEAIQPLVARRYAALGLPMPAIGA